MRSLRNVSASVRQRLLNRARSDRRPFSELLQYFAMERFLYRLSKSLHARRFVLKGALLLRVWNQPQSRATMDIDLLGDTRSDESVVRGQIRDVLTVDVPDDGLAFDPDSIQIERITEGADFEGVRIRFLGRLNTARIHMQIDVGFGDVVYPAPEESDLPTILDFPAPRLLCYSRESAVSEKLEAMVKLGRLNSRMKDFYDIGLLAREFDFDGSRLVTAVRLTFEQRGTALPSEVDAFTQSFIDAKQLQWSAFRKRLKQDRIPESFGVIVASVREFVSPVVAALSCGRASPGNWASPGPWT